MKVEVVAIGAELLLGEAVDTNSAWISARLAEHGATVTRHATVGDEVGAIAAVLGEAAARAEAVIVTGGLGPTTDDVTREAVAKVAGVPLERRHELAEAIGAYWRRSGREMPAANLVQADLPAGARALPPVGTAPGFAIAVGQTQLYCLPGVPQEMRTMVSRDVLPDLVERHGLAVTLSRMVRTAGMAESAVSEACAPVSTRLEPDGSPSIAFLASGGETRVRLTATAERREEAEALLEPLVAEVVELLGAGVVGLDDEGVEHAIARQLGQLGWRLAVGESVTGGRVAARLTGVPGASGWLAGSFVAYTEAAKRALGVEAELLAAEGPVSDGVVAALAAAARRRLDADAGVAVVGVAGPEAQGGQPVGTVRVAVVLGDAAPTVRSRAFPARERTQVQDFAASFALDVLRRRLAEHVGAPA